MASTATMPKSTPISDWEYEYEDLPVDSANPSSHLQTTLLPLQLPKDSLPPPPISTDPSDQPPTPLTARLLPPLLELPSGLFKLEATKPLGSFMVLDGEGKVVGVCREAVKGARVSVVRREDAVVRMERRDFGAKLKELMDAREKEKARKAAEEAAKENEGAIGKDGEDVTMGEA